MTGHLQKADYLAAVSGGSYIAAGMSMVAKTWPDTEVDRPPEGKDGHDDSDPRLVTSEHPPFYRNSPEEQYLRNRSAYLAPNLSGKLGLGYRVLLGFVFNLGFLTMALAPMGFFLGLAYREAFPSLRTRVGVDDRACAQVRTGCVFVASAGERATTTLWVFLALGTAAGLWSIIWRFQHDWARAAVQTWSFRFLVGVGVAATFIVLIPATLAALRNLSDLSHSSAVTAEQARAVGAVGGGSLATVLLGVFLQLRSRIAEPAVALQSVTGFRRWFGRLTAGVRRAITYFAGAVAGPLLLVAIVVWFALLTVKADNVSTAAQLLVAASLTGFVVLYLGADLTSWSLHPFYRRRLSTAFALKRVVGKDGRLEARERDYSELVPLSKTAVDLRGGWPTLLVCAAANISNPGATPPGRGVTSFTFSAHSLGGPLVGAVSTTEFEGALPKNRRRDFTLVAAVAMSGAALSPSMGKMTRRPLTFLMALANIRLGVWVPNPRRVSNWKQRHVSSWIRRPRPSYLLRELLGLNSVNANFLYVTDGGHYENLGLVELLRRGCANVYCFDASGGRPGTYATLGDAIALARSELGVEIDIDPSPLTPDKEARDQLASRDCVAGTISFPDGTRGRLVYARTVVTKAAPWDVHAYHESDTQFPNHPTADQLYTDQKFEAYRALGELAGYHSIQLMEGNVAPTDSASSGMIDLTGLGGKQPVRQSHRVVGRRRGPRRLSVRHLLTTSIDDLRRLR